MRRKSAGFLPAAALMLAVASIGLGLVVAGSDAAHGQNQPPRGAIPEQAFVACEGLEVEAACPITAPDGAELTGQCLPTPDEKLACMPAGDMPPPPRN